MINNFGQLLDSALKIRGKRVVVIYPNNDETFGAIRAALDMGLVRFVLVGDEELIRQKLQDREIAAGFEVVPEKSVQGALNAAIELIREGKCDVLMKGGVDTSTMMKAVLQEDAGIRNGRLLSDIFVLEFPARAVNKFVMITDGGMTMAPDLKNKVELINNAVEVAHALGNPNPKVAVLSATEFVLPNLPSTLDAAALSKMNERGQIKGCVVDWPYALDNAISMEAAEEKRLN